MVKDIIKVDENGFPIRRFWRVSKLEEWLEEPEQQSRMIMDSEWELKLWMDQAKKWQKASATVSKISIILFITTTTLYFLRWMMG